MENRSNNIVKGLKKLIKKGFSPAATVHASSQMMTGIMLASLLTIFTASGCIVANRPYYRTLPAPGQRQVVTRAYGGPAYYSGFYNPWWAINGNFYGSPYVIQNGPIGYRRFGRRGVVRQRGFRGGRRGVPGRFRNGRRGGGGGGVIRRAPNRIRPR